MKIPDAFDSTRNIKCTYMYMYFLIRQKSFKRRRPQRRVVQFIVIRHLLTRMGELNARKQPPFSTGPEFSEKNNRSRNAHGKRKQTPIVFAVC